MLLLRTSQTNEEDRETNIKLQMLCGQGRAEETKMLKRKVIITACLLHSTFRASLKLHSTFRSSSDLNTPFLLIDDETNFT